MSLARMVDIVLVAVFILIVYVSAKKGFVRLFMSLAALGVSAILAVLLTGLFVPSLTENWAGPNLERFITSRTSSALPDNATLDTLLSTADRVMSVVGGILNNDEGADKPAQSGTTAAATTAAAARTPADDTAEKKDSQGLFHNVAFAFAGAALSFIMFAVLFSLILAILRVMIDRLEFIDRIPIVGKLNTLLGLSLGLILGAAALMIPIWFLTSALPSLMDGRLSFSQSLLADSYVLHILYYLYPVKAL